MADAVNLAGFSIFHYGYPVDDMDVGKAQYAQAMGLKWTSEDRHVVAEVTTQDGPIEIDILCTFSVGDGPYVELIQDMSGSLSGLPALNHVGAWVEDFDAATAQLESQGMPMCVRGIDPLNGGNFAYHAGLSGTLIELADIRLKPDFDLWISGNLRQAGS
jgi:hypothetical protein